MKDGDCGFITVVSGLPRSGTSLMMQMLVAGGMPILTDQVREADDDNPRGYFEFEPVKRTRQDPSWLPAALGRAVKVVYLLLYHLPVGYRYRVVFMKRTLNEVVASQRTLLLRQGKSGAALTDLRLAQVFADHLNKLGAWLQTQEHMAVLPICYNELVADPINSISLLNRFLGGRLDVEAMAKVVDAALYRQRG